jgi:hypothetical protein
LQTTRAEAVIAEKLETGRFLAAANAYGITRNFTQRKRILRPPIRNPEFAENRRPVLGKSRSCLCGVPVEVLQNQKGGIRRNAEYRAKLARLANLIVSMVSGGRR